LGWPSVIIATILGRLVAFVTWLADLSGDKQERQEQKWQKKSEDNAWVKRPRLKRK